VFGLRQPLYIDITAALDDGALTDRQRVAREK
jgi:hypothetical protein